jgi:L-fucose mutarotase
VSFALFEQHGRLTLNLYVGAHVAEMATHTTTGKHIVLTVSLPEALDAICSVLPLDYFEQTQAMYMSPQVGVELPAAGVEVVSALRDAITRRCGDDTIIEPIERFSFYEEAKGCFAVIQTMERRPYGNVILIKGCVGPDGNDLRP